MIVRSLLLLAAVLYLTGCAPVANWLEGPDDARQSRSVPPHERRALETAEVRTTPGDTGSSAATAGSASRQGDTQPAQFVTVPTTVASDNDSAPVASESAAPAGRPNVSALPPLMEDAGDEPLILAEDPTSTGENSTALSFDDSAAGPAKSVPGKSAPATSSTTPPPAAKESPAATGESERIEKTIFDLHTIYFKTDSVEITSTSRELLDENARMLTDNSAVSVVIEGHTDAAGSPRYNHELSKRRAESVAEYLVSRGVARNRMEIAVYGEERPLDASATPAARAKNRRVQFLVYYPELGPAPTSSGNPSP